MNDIMLDLETMSLESNAAIVAIGAVQFDIIEKKLGAEFYVSVDLASSVDAGLDLDPDTVMWWLGQDKEAQAALMVRRIPLRDAMIKFNDWLASLQIPWGERRVWGNGAAYDNVVMNNAYKAVGVKQGWKYKHDMCYRTIRTLALDHTDIDRPADLVWHTALADAKYQALNLLDMGKVAE